MRKIFVKRGTGPGPWGLYGVGGLSRLLCPQCPRGKGQVHHSIWSSLQCWLPYLSAVACLLFLLSAFQRIGSQGQCLT